MKENRNIVTGMWKTCLIELWQTSQCNCENELKTSTFTSVLAGKLKNYYPSNIRLLKREKLITPKNYAPVW